MIPRSFLLGLLLALAILLVSFAVVMGGYGLASGTGDANAAAVFWYLGMAILTLLVIDLILLIGTMAFVVLGPGAERRERREEEGEGLEEEIEDER